jgi:hypothetical protein
LEDYAACFDELLSRLPLRRGFRGYLTDLLAPRDCNKTLTGLAGAEPVKGAQHAAVQRLQYFLSQSTWDVDQINRRRLELLVNDPATAPHERGMIAIDHSGDRKDGTRTAHVGRQRAGPRQDGQRHRHRDHGVGRRACASNATAGSHWSHRSAAFQCNGNGRRRSSTVSRSGWTIRTRSSSPGFSRTTVRSVSARVTFKRTMFAPWQSSLTLGHNNRNG